MARLISGKLEQRLGKTFVIENKPGAGSIVAATYVQKSAPDGHTLLMAPAPTMAVNVSLYKNLPYDPTADFSLVGLFSGTPFVLMVNPGLPVKSVPELLAYAKANSDKMTFASAGPGVPHHLFMELFMHMTGMKASHVPYRGSLPALNDLTAGHIPMMFSDLGPATGLLQAGRVRPLGISTRTRHPSFPDIAPLNEAGVPGYEAVSWQAMAAPAQTPKPVLDKLNSEITAVLAMPEVREQILKYGFLPLQNRSVDELKDFVKSEIARWGKVVRDAGIAGSQ
jgi:tripartite-type tricarboxylate transporter receptor subunit TctC